MVNAPLTPNFRKLITGINVGEKIAPLVRSFLWDPTIPSFDITMPDMKTRAPDGWFHPSAHPMMTERELYYYLAHPDEIISEVLDPHSTMAITQGHFWHELIGQVLGLAGVLITHDSAAGKAVMEAGGLPVRAGAKSSDVEWGFEHRRTMARGSVDGLIVDEGIFEFKTMDERIASKLPQGAVDSRELVDAYRERKPEYYGQAQEYMRLSGYRIHRTLILSLSYPFPMREIVIPYDEQYCLEVAMKYERVLDAVNGDGTPDPCCAAGSARARSCFARTVCPVGVVS